MYSIQVDDNYLFIFPFLFLFSDYSITDKRVSFRLFLFYFLGSCQLGVPPFSPGSLDGTAHIVLIVTLQSYVNILTVFI